MKTAKIFIINCALEGSDTLSKVHNQKLDLFDYILVVMEDIVTNGLEWCGNKYDNIELLGDSLPNPRDECKAILNSFTNKREKSYRLHERFLKHVLLRDGFVNELRLWDIFSPKCLTPTSRESDVILKIMDSIDMKFIITRKYWIDEETVEFKVVAVEGWAEADTLLSELMGAKI